MSRRPAVAFGLIAIFLLVLVLPRCKGGPGADTEKRVDTGYADVVLKLDPDPAVALRDVEFTAEVRDGEGAPLRGAEVIFDLSMPGMYHGENRPAAAEAGPGIYRATGVFTMGGKWLVAVEVRAPGLDVVRKFYTIAKGG